MVRRLILIGVAFAAAFYPAWHLAGLTYAADANPVTQGACAICFMGVALALTVVPVMLALNHLRAHPRRHAPKPVKGRLHERQLEVVR
jgi:hypothetical protein